MSVRGRERFKKFKPFIIAISIMFKVFPISIRKKIFVSYRNVNGVTGIVLRYALLRTIAKKCGDNVAIDTGCYIFCPEKLSIGSNVSINPMCYIDASGEIEIGDDVSIAHMVTVMSTTHNYELSDMPIKDQGISVGKTTIKNNVWVGAKATIICGVVIGERTIVGANALVNRNTEGNCIVAGIPAKIIKEI